VTFRSTSPENRKFLGRDDPFGGTSPHDRRTTSPKRARKRLEQENAQAIGISFRNQRDQIAKKLSEDFGYSSSTFYKTIRNKGVVPEAYQNAHHQTKWSSEPRDIAAEIIAQNPLLTLREIVAEAVRQGCSRISSSPLNIYLETMLISRKRAVLTPQQRNSEEKRKKCRDRPNGSWRIKTGIPSS
jgi:transposase